MSLSIDLSERPASVDADIVLLIKYDEETSSAAHAFEIAAELIRSLEDLDRVLTQSIDPKLTTALIIEDLEKSRVCGHSGFPFCLISDSNSQNGGLNERAALCGVGQLVAAA